MQAGYFILDNSANEEYQPSEELAAFLDANHPIYIGFGSLVVDDSEVRHGRQQACQT